MGDETKMSAAKVCAVLSLFLFLAAVVLGLVERPSSMVTVAIFGLPIVGAILGFFALGDAKARIIGIVGTILNFLFFAKMSGLVFLFVSPH